MISLKAIAHGFGSWFAIVAIPSSESCHHPSGEGEVIWRMGGFLFFGFAFELARECQQDRPVIGLEGIGLGGIGLEGMGEKLACLAVAGLHQLHDGGGGKQGKSCEGHKGFRVTQFDALNVEASCLEDLPEKSGGTSDSMNATGGFYDEQAETGIYG